MMVGGRGKEEDLPNLGQGGLFDHERWMKEKGEEEKYSLKLIAAGGFSIFFVCCWKI